MSVYTQQTLSAELNEFMSSIQDLTPDKQLISLNKWLPERITKLPTLDSSKDGSEPSKNVRSISSKFPITWKDKSVYPYTKPDFSLQDYALYLSTMNSNSKTLPTPNVGNVATAVTSADVFYKMRTEDYLLIIANKNQETFDDFGLKLSDLLKVTIPQVTDVIINVMNGVLLMEGDFCNEFRSFRVVPTYKGGDKNDVKRFRPLIRMPILVRILDSFLSRKTHDLVFTGTEPLVNATIQKAAARDTSGIFGNLFAVNTRLNRIKEFKHNTLALFLDFVNAYGSVNYALMRNILEKQKFPPVLVNYFTRYYSNATGYCKESDTKSYRFSWRNGLLQGSALSNILFLIYADFTIKNLVQDFKKIGYLKSDWSANENINGYVDDFVLFLENLDQSKEDEMFATMKLIFSLYGFKINCDKTFFYTPNKEKTNINFDGSNVGRVPFEFRYLGQPLVIFDETGEWLVDKIQDCLFQIDSFDISSNSKMTIYNNIMVPRINRMVEAMVHNANVWKSYEKILFIERYFFMRWGFQQDLLQTLSQCRKMHLIVNLGRKVSKIPGNAVLEFMDQSILKTKYGMTNTYSINTEHFIKYAPSSTPNSYAKDEKYQQKYDILEKELKALKESKKYDPLNFKKMQTSFYVDNFVEHIN